MREILFRGKRIDNGEWVYGSLVYWPGDNEIGTIVVFEEDEAGFIFGEHVEVDLNTVGQYIGYMDKNYKKIFEGDIVKVRQDQNDGLGTIGYENGSFMVYPISGNIYERTLFEYWYNDWDLECIGNKWDNPELMDVK